MEKDRITDRLANEILTYFYGDRFRKCDNLEDDYEMNAAWEYFSEIIYAELYHFEEKLLKQKALEYVTASIDGCQAHQ